MKNLTDFRNFNLKQFDTLLINYLSRISLPVLRVSLGVIFIWFGALKPFGDSPANDVITKTIYWFDPDIFIPILGYWEMLIGWGKNLALTPLAIKVLHLLIMG